MTKKEALWAAEKKKMGYTFEEIGKAMHLTPQTVAYWMQKYRINCRRPPLHMPPRCCRKEWIWESLLEGYTMQEIAAAAQISPARVRDLLEGRRRIKPPLTTRWIEGGK